MNLAMHQRKVKAISFFVWISALIALLVSLVNGLSPVVVGQQLNGSKSDFSSLVGLPEEYADSVKAYFQVVIDLAETEGKWPERIEHQLIRDNKKRLAGLDWNNYPLTVRLGEPQTVPVTLMILPDPKVIRNSGPVGPDFDALEAESPVKWPNDWREHREGWKFSIEVEEFYVPKESTESWALILPTPFNTQNIGGNQTDTIGWQRHLCRQQSYASFEEFNHFPELQGKRKDQAVWEGIVATGVAVPENSIVRWVVLKKAYQPEVKRWLAFAIIDSCGAYSIPIINRDISQAGSFLRPLDAPFIPALAVSDDGQGLKLPDAPAAHNLLRLARPAHLVAATERASKRFSEEWTLCEEFYSEGDNPAWTLGVKPGSQPYREHFLLTRFGEKTEGETWKVIVFASITPKNLAELISKFAQVKIDKPTLVKLEEKFQALQRSAQALPERQKQ